MNLNRQETTPKPSTNDAIRPIYHFLPRQNWMNDPNGVIHWKGRYHLFFQYNPAGAYHDNMHWGHAVSDDLVYWQELPIALTPDAGTADEGGVFSGCIVDDNGIPTAFYTGVNQGYSLQRQCLAVGDDDLVTWQKHAGNPVIPAPPPHANQLTDFRDPFVWRDENTWYMAVGSRIAGVGGAVFLYKSSNLQNWHYLNPLFVGDSARHGPMWECPNFFQLGEKWVLIVSSHSGQATGNVMYFVGDYRDHRFYPEYESILDSGAYYAPLTHLDEKGRRLMWGWIREARSDVAQVESGWSGVQAIPRVLTLDAQHRIEMRPVAEIEQLRAQLLIPLADLQASPATLPGLAFDLEVSFRIEDDQICGVVVKDQYTNAKVWITYDPTLETLNVNHNLSEDDKVVVLHGRRHRLEPDETLDLRVLFDKSVIEVIANHRTSITQRVYPTRLTPVQLDFECADRVSSFEIWEMKAIW